MPGAGLSLPGDSPQNPSAVARQLISTTEVLTSLSARDIADRTRDYSTAVVQSGKLQRLRQRRFVCFWAHPLLGVFRLSRGCAFPFRPLHLFPQPFATEAEQAAAFLSEALVGTSDMKVRRAGSATLPNACVMVCVCECVCV